MESKNEPEDRKNSGEGWKVIDVSKEATEADKRLLKAIFGEE